jgi:hypothetical protein
MRRTGSRYSSSNAQLLLHKQQLESAWSLRGWDFGKCHHWRLAQQQNLVECVAHTLWVIGGLDHAAAPSSKRCISVHAVLGCGLVEHSLMVLVQFCCACRPAAFCRRGAMFVWHRQRVDCCTMIG